MLIHFNLNYIIRAENLRKKNENTHQLWPARVHSKGAYLASIQKLCSLLHFQEHWAEFVETCLRLLFPSGSACVFMNNDSCPSTNTAGGQL